MAISRRETAQPASAQSDASDRFDQLDQEGAGGALTYFADSDRGGNDPLPVDSPDGFVGYGCAFSESRVPLFEATGRRATDPL